MKKYLLSLFFIVSCIISVSAQTYHYTGTIGEYQVKVTLTRQDGSRGMTTSENWDSFTGKYTYVKAGNSLNLKGKGFYGMSMTTTLTETTPKGKKSAEWYLEGVPGLDEELTGEFTNLSNGKTFPIKLRESK